MNLIKSLFCLVLFGTFLPLTAQTEDFYIAPMPDNAGSSYLFYKPDSGFASVMAYNRQINKAAIQPVILKPTVAYRYILKPKMVNAKYF